MLNRSIVVTICSSLLALGLAACVVGDIEGPPGASTKRKRDAGPASGGSDLPGDDLPDPPPGDETPAPPPPSSDVDSSAPAGEDVGAPPPPATDSGTAPAPPADTAPPPTGEYPSGPYGLSAGSVVANLTLNGYRAGTGAWGPMKIAEYYDPTGARGVKGLLITVSAAWCAPCREEAKDLVAMYAPTYKPRGARFLTAMIEDTSRNPATQATVDSWIKMAAINFDIVADPAAQLFGGTGLPYNFVVDPRTMKITKTWSGSDPGATSVPELDTVLTKNGG